MQLNERQSNDRPERKLGPDRRDSRPVVRNFARVRDCSDTNFQLANIRQILRGKGSQNPVTVLAAIALLWNYDIDIFKHIIDAFAEQGAGETSSTFLGRAMTGLLVAGGSGAIFNLFAKMGLRNPTQLAAKAEAERERVRKAKDASGQAAPPTSPAAGPPSG